MSPCNDVSTALSYMDYESPLHVSLMPLGMKAAHDLVVKVGDLQVRWKSLEQTKLEKIKSTIKHTKVFEIPL